MVNNGALGPKDYLGWEEDGKGFREQCALGPRDYLGWKEDGKGIPRTMGTECGGVHRAVLDVLSIGGEGSEKTERRPRISWNSQECQKGFWEQWAKGSTAKGLHRVGTEREKGATAERAKKGKGMGT